jgi:ATP-grasp in the biosynthetic pathway with Ter operon
MVLIPCSDAWVAAVARLEPTLAARFPASIAPAESLAICLDKGRSPLEVLDRLLPALRYRGVFNAQFKYDDRDALFKLIEINPRPRGGVSLAVSCGVDVIKRAYLDALELPVQPIREHPVGCYWVYPSRDRIVCWQLFREGRLSAGALDPQLGRSGAAGLPLGRSCARGRRLSPAGETSDPTTAQGVPRTRSGRDRRLGCGHAGVMNQACPISSPVLSHSTPAPEPPDQGCHEHDSRDAQQGGGDRLLHEDREIRRRDLQRL